MKTGEAKGPSLAALYRGNDGLCLDFANSMAWRGAAESEERLGTPDVFLAWCGDHGLLDARAVKSIAARWQAEPGEAEKTLRKAVFVREAIYQLFRTVILGQAPSTPELDAFNEALDLVPQRRHLGAEQGDLGWTLSKTVSPEMGALAHIVWSAADLLSSRRASRIKQCEDERGCGWLFLDESRAGTRKWCAMDNCGNRAKAHRHHLRQKRGKAKAKGRS